MTAQDWRSDPRPTRLALNGLREHAPARYRSPNLPPTNAVAVPAARTIHLLNTGPPVPPVLPPQTRSGKPPPGPPRTGVKTGPGHLPGSPYPRQPAGTFLRAAEARVDAPGDLPPLSRRLAAQRTQEEPRRTVGQGTRTGLMARPTARPRLGREWGSVARGWALVLGILALGAVAGVVVALLLAWWFGWPGVL